MKLLDRSVTDQNGSIVMPEIGVAWEIITPEQARRLLQRNAVNRRLDEKVARRYARDMREGVWDLTGESMVIDSNGDLVDGQYRCRACVIAGVPFVTVVVRGVTPRDAQLSMGSGKKRNLGDQLTLLGEKNTSDLATTINFCWAYDNRALPYRDVPSRAEAIRWLEENGGCRNSVLIGRRVATKLPISRTVVSRSHYLISRVDAEEADEFFSRLVAGTDLDEGNPILACRRWFDRWAGKRDQPSSTVHTHAIIKCSNYWRSGTSLKFVKVLAGEAFPRVWGEEEA